MPNDTLKEILEDIKALKTQADPSDPMEVEDRAPSVSNECLK